jgi:NADPH:quinone reductase-like Zn-dependent oxidoreductase
MPDGLPASSFIGIKGGLLLIRCVDNQETRRMDGLSDKTIVVTGGAGGIGLATVQRLVKAGSRVVIADLVSSNGESTAAEVDE